MESILVVAEQQQTINKNTKTPPAQRYSNYVQGIYSLYSTLFDEETTRSLMSVFGSKLQQSGPPSYYKHDKLQVYRIAVDTIYQFGPAKCTLSESLTTVEAVPLVLRDLLLFSIEDIAAITNLAEGSARMRIEKSRYRFTNVAEGVPIPNSNHYCIVEKEYIEDHQESNSGTSCPSCSAYNQAKKISRERFLNTQHNVPEDLLNIPVAPVLVKDGSRTLLNWSAAPWYVRVITEGFLATALVMGVVFSAPKIKSVYELWQEKRIDLSGLTELASSFNAKEIEEISSEAPVENPDATTEASDHTTSEQTDKTKKPITTVTSVFTENDGTAAASHKVYRIMIKTDSPDSLKANINTFMTSIKAEVPQQQASYGVDLPGGVLFDVYIPVKSYRSLLNELGKHGEMKVIITQSHQRSIPGKARIKVWLQRI